MKRQAIMMLIAGFFLGAVLSFITTREYYRQRTDNRHQAPAATGSEYPAARSGGPSFDPAQHEAMLAAIKEDLRKHPDDVAKRAMLANIFYDARKYEEAAPLYEEVLRKTPENTDVMVDLGVCYHRLGRSDDALALFDRALKIEPAKMQALFNKVIVLYMDKGDRKAAEKVLETLKQKYPDEPMVDRLKETLEQRRSGSSSKGNDD